MPFEPPQSGNPHQFTLNQHIHMAHCISKFYGSNGKVEVCFKKTGEIVSKKKDAALFYAKRAWDERAEKGFMQDIEDAFRKTINGSAHFVDRNHVAISRYFALWQLRHTYGINDIGDIHIPGICGSELTKSEEEILESRGITFIRTNGSVPSRFMVGISMQTDLDNFFLKYKNEKWGLIRATSGEFICPDCCKNLAIIPISPSLAFVAGRQDGEITDFEVRIVNKELVDISTHFYFARDLSQCPR